MKLVESKKTIYDQDLLSLVPQMAVKQLAISIWLSRSMPVLARNAAG